MLKHLPNAITSGNLVCGCLGIIECFSGNLTTASLLILVAAIFDFFDGFVARAVKANSAMGKELDSLADCVSFGVLPSMMMYHLIFQTMLTTTDTITAQRWAYLALIMAVFSALRLAKFNIDTRQSDSFIGVPTPANAMLIASFPWLLQQNSILTPFLQNVYVLIAITVVMSFLLVAELPLIALKFKDFSWKNNQYTYTLVLISLLLLLALQITAIPLIILVYIGLSMVKTINS
ncbi:MAG: CDP-diacylglycerol--serine O-phosphatidyltransferase [Thermoflexibacteraceae bacterium]|jgi:CDP-diacylglycerol--serine O-phosphatidyltransferase